MQHLAPRRIPNVVFGLSIFWSIIFSAFFWDMDSNFSFLLPWLICILVGIWLAQSSSEAYVQNILKSLKYRSDLQLPVAAKGAFFNEMGGISSTLGPIPFPNRALAGASSCDFSELKAHAPAELAGDATLAGVLGYYLGPTGRDRHPAHVALFDAIARIFLHPSHVNCPAGIDKHGGRTLLSHSLLVCALMVHRAPSYLYRATRLKAINPHYKLDPLDPLLPVIGLAHDIGKLRAFIFDEHGNVCGIDPGHETEGSRIMALVHEFWDERIDIEERRVLQTVLAYYHREHSIPVQKNEQIERPTVTSDRLHALIGLLHECDRLASTIEMGERSYAFTATPIEFILEPNSEAEKADDLLERFAHFMAVSASVNGVGSVKSVAFKYNGEFTLGRDVLIFDELLFVPAFAKYLDKPEYDVRKGKTSAITTLLLETLDANSYLFRVSEDIGFRPAANCLYSIDFMDVAKSDVKPAFNLKSGFLVDITEWPKMSTLRTLPNCHAVPSIRTARFGMQGLAFVDSIPAPKPEPKLKANSDKPYSKIVLSPENSILEIGKGLMLGAIKPTPTTKDGVIAIVGFDSFFESKGICIKEYPVLPETILAIGICQISKSKNENFLGQHVVMLDQSIYASYAPKF